METTKSRYHPTFHPFVNNTLEFMYINGFTLIIINAFFPTSVPNRNRATKKSKANRKNQYAKELCPHVHMYYNTVCNELQICKQMRAF